MGEAHDGELDRLLDALVAEGNAARREALLRAVGDHAAALSQPGSGGRVRRLVGALVSTSATSTEVAALHALLRPVRGAAAPALRTVLDGRRVAPEAGLAALELLADQLVPGDAPRLRVLAERRGPALLRATAIWLWYQLEPAACLRRLPLLLGDLLDGWGSVAMSPYSRTRESRVWRLLWAGAGAVWMQWKLTYVGGRLDALDRAADSTRDALTVLAQIGSALVPLTVGLAALPGLTLSRAAGVVALLRALGGDALPPLRRIAATSPGAFQRQCAAALLAVLAPDPAEPDPHLADRGLSRAESHADPDRGLSAAGDDDA